MEYSIPQASLHRVAPELYIIIGVLAGISAELLWAWIAAVVVLFIYPISVFLILLPLLDRLSSYFPVKMKNKHGQKGDN